MKKCKITVEKTYSSRAGELKTIHSLEVDEDGLYTLCLRLKQSLTAHEDGDFRHLFELLRAF